MRAHEFAGPTKLLFWAAIGIAALTGCGQSGSKSALIQHDIIYAESSSANRLDVYAPERPTGKDPLVIFIHGGAFMMGDKADPEALDRLLAEGFVVSSINYRLSSEAKWPAQLADLRAAVAHLRGNAVRYGIDPDRIGVWGASAGGHLAAMAGIALAGDEKTRVQAVVDWFGPIDFTRMDSDMAKLGRTGKMGLTDEADSPESKLIGAPVGQHPEKAFAASPLSYLSRLPNDVDAPPFLIMHGADDPLIAPGQSQRLYRALIKRGGPSAASLKILPDSGHGDGQFAHQSSEDAVVAFFKKNLQQ